MAKADQTPTAYVTTVRVRDKDTGAEYDVAETAINPEFHTRVNAPAAYPDLHGETVQARPIKYRTDKAGQPVNTEKES